MTTPYPLAWPQQFPRTKTREAGRFKTTLAAALRNVEDALRLFGQDSGREVSAVVISSNQSLGSKKLEDPGIAVWFNWDGDLRCIPVDRYQSVEANLQAVFHVLEARRTEMRHGTLTTVRAAMSGFKALPARTPATSCWDILGVPIGSSKPDIETAFKKLAKNYHPDLGGSDRAMSALNRARAEAIAFQFPDAWKK